MPALQQPETASGTAPRSSEKGPSPVTDSLAKLEDGGSPAGTPAPSLQAPPDGGWEAWSTVLAGWLILFCTFGYTNSFGIFESYYVGALGKSASEIAWIGSFQLWLQFSIGLIVGRAFDDGYGKALVIGGAAFYIICIFITSLCKEYWQVFLAQGLGVGLGLGVLFLSAISVLPQWFQRKRVLAIGIVMSGSGVGGVGFPIMLNKLIEHHNYAYAVRTSGYLITGLLIIALRSQEASTHLRVPTSNFRSIIRHKTYWVAIVAVFLVTWGLFLPVFYLQVFAELNGTDPNLALYLVSILNAASVFGRIIPNFLADRFGCLNLLTLVSGCTTALIFVFPVAKSQGGIIVFAILYGFFSGAVISLIPGCWTSLSSHVGETGVRVGFANSVVGFASLTGSPIAGALLRSGNNDWWMPVGFAGAAFTVGTITLGVARTMHANEKNTSRV